MKDLKTVNSIWKCIDESNDEYNKFCKIIDIDLNLDHNGDGGIQLLYSDGYTHYGKVRRFIPNVTHIYINKDISEILKLV